MIDKETILVNMISLFQGGPKMVGFGLIHGILGGRYVARRWILMLPRSVGFEEFVRSKGLPSNIECTFVNYPTNRFRFLAKLVLDHIYTPYLCRRWRVDTLFMTANFASMFVSGKKQIVLQHNVHYLSGWNMPWPKIGPRSVRFQLELALFKITTYVHPRYVVQLDCVKDHLAKRYRVGNERIRVVTMVPLPSDRPQAMVDEICCQISRQLESLGNGGINLFFPAKLHPNKNHEILIPLAKILKEEKIRARVFITLEEDCTFLRRVKSAGLESIICNLGYIDHLVIGSVYALFDVLFFPTYSESYGLPYVEAIRAGIPIITTDYDFSREVCGDAAIYFAQDDIDGALLAITTLLDSEKRGKLSDKTKQRAKKFAHDWDQVISAIFTGVNS